MDFCSLASSDYVASFLATSGEFLEKVMIVLFRNIMVRIFFRTLSIIDRELFRPEDMAVDNGGNDHFKKQN